MMMTSSISLIARRNTRSGRRPRRPSTTPTSHAPAEKFMRSSGKVPKKPIVSRAASGGRGSRRADPPRAHRLSRSFALQSPYVIEHPVDASSGHDYAGNGRVLRVAPGADASEENGTGSFRVLGRPADMPEAWPENGPAIPSSVGLLVAPAPVGGRCPPRGYAAWVHGVVTTGTCSPSRALSTEASRRYTGMPRSFAMTRS